MMNSGQLRGAVGGIWVRQKTTRRGYCSLVLGVPKRGKPKNVALFSKLPSFPTKRILNTKVTIKLDSMNTL